MTALISALSLYTDMDTARLIDRKVKSDPKYIYIRNAGGYRGDAVLFQPESVSGPENSFVSINDRGEVHWLSAQYENRSLISRANFRDSTDINWIRPYVKYHLSSDEADKLMDSLAASGWGQSFRDDDLLRAGFSDSDMTSAKMILNRFKTR